VGLGFGEGFCSAEGERQYQVSGKILEAKKEAASSVIPLKGKILKKSSFTFVSGRAALF
jgi:hypothetical protein